MKSKLFRDAAIQRLSSPEELDQAIQITRPLNWLGLAALALFLAFAVYWSVVTKAPVTVPGHGVFVDRSGVLELNVVTTAEGRVTAVFPAPGDTVRAGQVVAVVDQTEMRDRLGAQREEREDLARKLAALADQNRRELARERELERQQRAELDARDASLAERLALLRRVRGNVEALVGKGNATHQELLDVVVQVSEAENQLEQVRSRRRELDLQLETAAIAREKELLEVRLRKNEAERQIALLEEALGRSTEVKSPYDGTVSEVKISGGEVVATGDPVLSVFPLVADAAADGPLHPGLQAVLYVPPTEGKKIAEGMEVNVVPSNYRREEYGAVRGRVLKVSDVAATAEGMLRTLKNARLAEVLAAEGAPFEVKVGLYREPANASDLRWSASAGPDDRIEAGTLCLGETTVREIHLLALALPALERLLKQTGRSVAAALPR